MGGDVAEIIRSIRKSEGEGQWEPLSAQASGSSEVAFLSTEATDVSLAKVGRLTGRLCWPLRCFAMQPTKATFPEGEEGSGCLPFTAPLSEWF